MKEMQITTQETKRQPKSGRQTIARMRGRLKRRRAGKDNQKQKGAVGRLCLFNDTIPHKLRCRLNEKRERSTAVKSCAICTSIRFSGEGRGVRP
jgi:hypothetical protein